MSKEKNDIAPPKEDVKLEATLTKSLSGPAKAEVKARDGADPSSPNNTIQPSAENLHIDTAISPSKPLTPSAESPTLKIGIHQGELPQRIKRVVIYDVNSGGMHDFWDMIIDRVSVIAECRSKEVSRDYYILVIFVGRTHLQINS